MIQSLTISDRDLELLAAGGGDTQTMAALQTGQFSRRVLLLQAVLESAPRTAPGAIPALESAYALLAAVQRTRPDVVREVLTLPCTGNWAAACLHGDNGDGGWHGYLGCLAASAAFRAGTSFEIEVPVLGGELCLPMLGTATFGGNRPRTAVISTGDGSELAIRTGRAVVRVPPEHAVAPGWRPARLLRASAGRHGLTIWLDDRSPFRAPPGPLLAQSPVTEEQAARWQRLLGQAWRLLVRRHPQDAAAMATTLRVLSPLRPSGNARGDSATAANAVGAVLLTPPQDAENLALTLLHEFQHGKLAALEHMVRLHTADPSPRYYAPWREDPRPLGALLHGAYAHLGVSWYWHALLTAGHKTADDRHRAIAEDQLAYWSAAVRDALRRISASGTLTAAGERLADGMARALGRLEEAAGRAARRRATERLRHDLTAWRARNGMPGGEGLCSELALR